MPIYTIALVEQHDVAHQTIELSFTKPEGFHFIPGQYGGFTIPSLLASQPTLATRRFTILSTPDEPVIRIATRVSPSPYKQALMALKPGDTIKMAGPSGQFTCHDDTSIPAVFIAGGIGITPFLSMIKEKTQTHSDQPMLLFYGNETIDSTPYLLELNAFQTKNTHFKCVATLSTPAPTWQGESGYITHTLIKKYLADIHHAHYYVCGSPNMVAALKELLLELDINPSHISIEDFPGY